MARFGLLLLNKGTWNGTAILADETYFNTQINTSQNLNLSYGYLTWLNGKTSYMLPNLQNVFNGAMMPNAPADMYAALGKNDQKIYVVPSQNLVIIRMGNSAGNSQLALSSFDNELWGKLNLVIR
jgi:CubicO group peptidase (beta-lactamase class C family)